MGIYLNNPMAYSLYSSEAKKSYFVDKTLLLAELFPLIESGNSHICITRPRRFGKTVMANMAAAFLGKGADVSPLFSLLAIAGEREYRKHMNQHDVIHIDFSKMPRECKSYTQYMIRIEGRLIQELQKAYPDAAINREDALGDILDNIFVEYGGPKFIFILDEWDYIFHKGFITEADKESYLSFLSNLLKDKAYVSLSYMTGILPIAIPVSQMICQCSSPISAEPSNHLANQYARGYKYSSGSELNMFLEYTMASEEKFSDDFGFTESEVDMLYGRYLKNTREPNLTREGLQLWYDGYHAKGGERMYNPRSVVAALTNNNLGSYWTSSGPYDEIFYYIEKNIDDVRNDLAFMAAGEAVPAKVSEYAATSMNLSTREEIFSAMVVYGFLSYEEGMVSIPNKELMGKFVEMLQKEPSLGYVNRLAKESERMLKATIAGDTKTMSDILAYAHNTETPIFTYNYEVELLAIVNLVYLSARDHYQIEREDKAGIGYVDFIFYPKYDRKRDGIILELKVDSTPEEAIQQILIKGAFLAP